MRRKKCISKVTSVEVETKRVLFVEELLVELSFSLGMEAAEARVRELLSSTADKVELRSNDLPALIKIMESLTDDQIRDKALNFISKTEIPKSDVDQPHSELNGLLLAKGSVKEWMMKGLENNNPDSLKVWKAVVGLLGKTLHQPKEGTLLMNSLLQVVEKAFKHSDVSMRVEANYCWMALMDNFALNHSILTSPKRINLIVRPLIVSNFFDFLKEKVGKFGKFLFVPLFTL